MYRKKGQSTLEYALITAVVIAGLLLMQHYMKHGYAGRLKSSTDDIGEQYDPSKYSAKFKVTNKSYTQQSAKEGATTQTYLDLGGDDKGYGRLQRKETEPGQKETISAYEKDENLYSK